MTFLELPILTWSDNSIDKYEHFEYGLITGTNLKNSGGYIRINIETQDLFTHPRESFLLIEGRLTKADGTAYANADLVSLTNDAMMHLFKTIKYQLSGPEIESIMLPGQATTMLGLLKYTDDFSKSQVQGYNNWCGRGKRGLEYKKNSTSLIIRPKRYI